MTSYIKHLGISGLSRGSVSEINICLRHLPATERADNHLRGIIDSV